MSEIDIGRLYYDLLTLDKAIADPELASELYQALTTKEWNKEGGRVSLKSDQAADLVNDVRSEFHCDELRFETTPPTTPRAEKVLHKLGWNLVEVS